MQQGSGSGANGGTAVASGPYVQPGGEVLTDEQILGLEPVGAKSGGDAAAQAAAARTGRDAGAANLAGDDDLNSRIASPESVSDDPSNTNAPSGDGMVEPAWLKTLDAQPEAAAEARRWRQAALDAATLDADYYSAEPGARSALAARLHSDDPAAFRAMVGEAARVLAERDPPGMAELARQLSAIAAVSGNGKGGVAKSLANAGRRNSSDDLASNPQRDSRNNPSQNDTSSMGAPGANFPVEAYRTFEAATNDDVARGLRDSIDRTLSATLPDGVADGARRRIAEDIFRDLNTTLSSDRDLSGKISDLLRGWRFNDATRQQLSGLLTGRARKALPEVARRVVSEWTSSVLASDRAKQSRINSAVSRRDITGGRLPEPVASSALLPRQVDYARTSDEQILEL